MADFTCTRCERAGERMAAPPFPTDLGNRLYDNICKACWSEWLKHQTAVINHYGLNLLDPQARQFLTQQTEAFLFGEAKD